MGSSTHSHHVLDSHVGQREVIVAFTRSNTPSRTSAGPCTLHTKSALAPGGASAPRTSTGVSRPTPLRRILPRVRSSLLGVSVIALILRRDRAAVDLGRTGRAELVGGRRLLDSASTVWRLIGDALYQTAPVPLKHFSPHLFVDTFMRFYRDLGSRSTDITFHLEGDRR